MLQVQCKADPAEVMNVEIRVLDRDGPADTSPLAFLSAIISDDLMG